MQIGLDDLFGANEFKVVNCPPRSDADYVPNDYRRSDVKYTHLLLSTYEQARGESFFPDIKTKLLFQNAIIAGGYVADFVEGRRGLHPNDMDLWFLSERHLQVTVDSLLRAGYVVDEADRDVIESEGYSGMFHLNTNSPHLKDKAFINLSKPGGNFPLNKTVQAIKIRYFDNAEHVIDCFDLTCIQFAIDVANDKLIYNPAGALDLAARRLVQHRIQSRARVLKRLEKYINKGFKPTPGFVVPEEK